jgi:septal ring factor EnvC (AmiA/AmiB activator)
MHKSVLRVIALLILVSVVLVGCSSGYTKEQYGALETSLKETQTKLTTSETTAQDTQKKLDDSQKELTATKTALTDAQKQIGDYKTQLTTAQAKLQDDQKQLEAAQKKLDEMNTTNQASLKLIKEESAVNAYLIWYDEYYGKKILNATTPLFNARMSNFVAASGDANSLAAFNAYLEKDTVYQQILAALPQDNSAWTKAQYDSWVAAGKERADKLGQVGGYLKIVMDKITWFNG